MNRRLYYFGIFVLTLTIVASLLQNILYWQLEGSLVMLDSFMGWHLTATVASLIGSIILLKYFRYREYHFAFLSLIIATVANLCQSIFLFFILSGTREWQRYYVFVIFFVLGSGILYAISLMSSSTRQKRWLNTAGKVMFLMASTLLIIVLATMNSTLAIQINLNKLAKGVELFGSLIPIPFILNFFDEIRMLKKGRSNFVLPEYMETVLGLTAMVLFSCMLIFGSKLWSDSIKKLYWQTKNSEETDKFARLCEERSFTNARGETLKYLLLKPIEYNPRTKYPLVVSLPYGKYESPPAQWLASDANRYRYPTFLFVPYCQDGVGWGGIPNYPTLDTLVFDAIAALEKEMSIDINRRYVTGVSRGGYGSWHFITTRPDMFAAAIPICGGGNSSLAAQIKNVSVWAFHGALDRNVPVAGSRDMIDAIKKAGGNPKYTEFSDKAHDIWYDITQMPGVWDWLFEQKQGAGKRVNR